MVFVRIAKELPARGAMRTKSKCLDTATISEISFGICSLAVIGASRWKFRS
jgi:hypothetical protein